MNSKEETHVYTVTELTKDIRFVLEEKFPEVWVEGEVSNLKSYPSGHVYFSLKDESSILRCVIFKSANSRLKFAVEDGMHVLCSGRISVYDKNGQYQLYVGTIEPKGKGALYAAFEQLKKKLSGEGLFDEARKKPIPFLPMRVGVVTSGTGAAIRDILKVSRRRFANIEITICPVKVQGDDARDEIAGAVELLNAYNEYLEGTGAEEHPVDVIIAGRGGGSLEDLWAFNEEVVARAIFASEIPVISAVGHEVDYTIADFVADRRAATPSAAAELVIPEKNELKNRVRGYTERLRAVVKSKLDVLGAKLGNLRDSYVLREPVNWILQLKQEIDDLSKRAHLRMAHRVELERSRFAARSGKLETLSPLSVLDRGYSITFKDSEIVKDAKRLRSGDRLLTRLARGEVRSHVDGDMSAGDTPQG